MLRLLLAALAVFWAWPALAVGFQTVMVPDPGNPPIQLGLWYPSDAATRPTQVSLDTFALSPDGPVAGRNLKLIVMSHGLGGGFADHDDTAYALAKAGFVAAALTHTGDNFKDGSRALTIWDRTRQLHVITDWLLATWPGHTHLNPLHIGVFGFSAGGFTALVAAGGVPDMTAIGPHCKAIPAEFTCALIAHGQPSGAGLPKPPAGAWIHDARIGAAVIAAPALGYTFGKPGLAKIRIPVELWRGASDTTLPQPFYAQAVADDLPISPEYHVVPNARHLDFLAPCSALKARIIPAVCESLPGFDRAAFHASFNTAIVGFFEKALLF